MRGGRVVRWSRFFVSGALIAGCGRASRNADVPGVGGSQNTSSIGGAVATSGAGPATAGSATNASGDGGATASGDGGATASGGSDDDLGGAAGEPSSSEEGGQGGVDRVDPLEWKLELQLVEPTPHQLELARAAAGDPASSGLIAVSEDSARVSRDGHVLSGYAYIGIDDPRATRGWRCLLP